MKKILLFFIPVLLIFQSRSTLAQDSTHHPKKIVLQYAGSIGYNSVGIAYRLKKIKSDVSFHFGYVGEKQGGELYIGTAKFIYQPVKINIGSSLTWYPVNPGMFMTYHFGKDNSLLWPRDQYPKGYYWWSPGVRFHPAVNSEVKLKLKPHGKKGIKGVSFYTEVNTNDLYLYSYFSNQEYITPEKIIKIGFGVFLYL